MPLEASTITASRRFRVGILFEHEWFSTDPFQSHFLPRFFVEKHFKLTRPGLSCCLSLLDCNNWASKRLDCDACALLRNPTRAALRKYIYKRTKKREGEVVKDGVKNEARIL